METKNYTYLQLKELVFKEEYLNEDFLNSLLTDRRKNVQKLVQKYYYRKNRSEELVKYENRLWNKGFKYVAGIDEAGRGPLAGPVACACVVFPRGFKMTGIDDSKKLSPAEREFLAEKIKEYACAYSIEFVYPDKIDKINIQNAVSLGSIKAARNLKLKPDFILLDGRIDFSDSEFKYSELKGGDRKSVTIAAASILAKTARDKMMIEEDSKYPQYNFKKNKGYGTQEHIDALSEFGESPIHRKTFVDHFLCDKYLRLRERINNSSSRAELEEVGREVKETSGDVISEKMLSKLRHLYKKKLEDFKKVK